MKPTYHKDPRELENLYYPAPASGQGKGRKNNELLITLNDDGEWVGNGYVDPVSTKTDNENQEDDLIAQIDARNTDEDISTDEDEKTELEPEDYHVQNGEMTENVRANRTNVEGVMSSDDPMIDYYYEDYYHFNLGDIKEENLTEEGMENPTPTRFDRTRKYYKGGERTRSTTPRRFVQKKKEILKPKSSRDWRHEAGETVYMSGKANYRYKNVGSRVERKDIKGSLKDIIKLRNIA